MRWYLLFLLPALFLAGCGFGGTGKPVYIAHVAPQSGPHKQIGQSQLRGIRLAVGQVTDDPESEATEIQQSEEGLGRPVVVIHADAVKNTRGAYEAEAVRLAVMNKVVGLLGGVTTEQAAGLAQEGLPVVSLAGLRTAKMPSRVYLLGLPPEFRGKVLAQVAAKRIKHTPTAAELKPVLSTIGLPWAGALAQLHQFSKQKSSPPKVLVLVDETQPEHEIAAETFITELRKQLQKKFTHAKIPDMLPWRYKKVKELEQYLQRLPREHPDAVFVAGAPDVASKVRAGFSERTVPILFAGHEGGQVKLLAQQQTKDAIYLVTAWTVDADTKANARFVKLFRETYNQEPDVYAALAFESAQLLFAGMRETKNSLTSKKISTKLEELEEIPNLTGAKGFTKDHILQRPAFAVELRNGKIVQLRKFNGGS